MNSNAILTPIEETIATAAQAIGHAIALEVAHDPKVETSALEAARRYAVTAGDSLGSSVQACLAYGNAVASAFDTTIRQQAVTAVVRTFFCTIHPRELVKTLVRNNAVTAPCPTAALLRRHADRRVWKGRLG